MPIFSSPQLLNSSRWAGLRVGLLGGSFNPPHEGHVHISRVALETLELDAVWWLVTPQNPLKDRAGVMPFEKRVSLSQEIMDHPKILVTDLERALGTTTTFQTVQKLNVRYSRTRFAWITGMDNALTLHQWNNWHELLKEICMVHITRQPAVSLIQQCPLRLLSGQKHIVLPRGGRVPLKAGYTYWLLQKKMVNVSSTEIRNRENAVIAG